MRKFKKEISLFLVVAMTMLMLAGCGGNDSADAGTDNGGSAAGTETENASSEADTSSEAADSESAGAASGEAFKIGAIGPSTGSAAVYGLAVQNGADLAIKEINAAGGIAGFQIEYNFQDDECDNEKSVNAYNTLKDWGMQMLVGSVTSNPCIAVVEKSQADNMFQLTPSGTAVDCVKYDNAFRMCFSDPSQGVESAKYIKANSLATKVAVIYDMSDTYSSGIYEAFRGEAENQGLEIVAAEAFTSETKKDFSVQVQKAKEAGAELLYMPFYYTEASLVLAECKKQNYEPVFFGVDGMDGILSIENFDASLAENLMYMAPFVANSDDEQVKNFVTKYQEQFNEIPNQFAADAYDCMYVIKAAAEEAGVTADMDASAICDALKEAMTTISFDGITGKGISWEAGGEPNKDPLIIQIQNGEGVAL